MKEIFLISINEKLKFIFRDADELAKILKKNESEKIDFVKKLDPSDLRFKKIAKKILIHSIPGSEKNKDFIKNHEFFN